MKRLILLIVLVMTAVFIQTWFFPRMFPIPWRPDLFLAAVVYLAFFSGYFHGALLCFGLGSLMDVFGGTVLGLYGFVYTALFFIIRVLISRINIETTFPFYYMVALGTFIELALLAFFFTFFGSRGGGVWTLVSAGLFPQVGLNLSIAYLLMKTVQALRRNSSWATDLPGPLPQEGGF